MSYPQRARLLDEVGGYGAQPLEPRFGDQAFDDDEAVAFVGRALLARQHSEPLGFGPGDPRRVRDLDGVGHAASLPTAAHACAAQSLGQIGGLRSIQGAARSS